MSELYPKWRSIPRLNRQWISTEKIDGTNGLIRISTYPVNREGPLPLNAIVLPELGVYLEVGSRNRWLSAEADNYGFYSWVRERARTLVTDLGVGHHYGEFYGKGIQRGYDLGSKRFALFNIVKFEAAARGLNTFATPGLDVVPLLGTEDTFSGAAAMVEEHLYELGKYGSILVEGFEKPEGLVVYHAKSDARFKVTLENDAHPKSVAAAWAVQPTPDDVDTYLKEITA